MIKFFRKIRRKMLSENKFSKYLLYAIGEIILVVIGILIALQINNLNERKKSQGLEQKLLRELKVDLNQNITDFEINIQIRKNALQVQNTLLEVMAQKRPYNDSLSSFFYYGRFLNISTLNVRHGAYDAIQSTGLTFITNDSIRNSLTEFYTEEMESIRVTESREDKMLDILIPFILEELESDPMNGLATPVDFESLISNQRFKQSITVYSYFQRGIIARYTKAVEMAKSLIEKIEVDLNETK